MKKVLLIFLFLIIYSHTIQAQKAGKWEWRDSSYNYNPPPNYPATYPFGIYLSTGIGITAMRDLSTWAAQLSCSFRYKSDLFSFSHLGFRTIELFAVPQDEDGINGNYFGFLFGKVHKERYSMCSASIGLGYSELSYAQYIRMSSSYGIYNERLYNGFSVPIELKAFVLADNVIGIGFHFSLNLTPLYCPTTFSISLVFGAWNIDR